MPVVSGLIETVDRVMEHMVTNLEPSPNSLISLGGTSFVAGQCAVSSPRGDSLFVVCVDTECQVDIISFRIQRTNTGQIS